MMMRRLESRSDRPLVLQLAGLLQTKFQGVSEGQGAQLPTQSEFQHAYGVSRATVWAALVSLASEG
jgi:DNA-binding GntR family transcriptional regulator